MKVYIVGHNIMIKWKTSCIWETSNKLKSNPHLSYTNGFESKIIIFNTFPKTYVSQIKMFIFSQETFEVRFSSKSFLDEFWLCGGLNAKTTHANTRFHTISMHNDVDHGPQYRVSKGKSHYNYAHNIYHKECSGECIMTSQLVNCYLCNNCL